MNESKVKDLCEFIVMIEEIVKEIKEGDEKLKSLKMMDMLSMSEVPRTTIDDSKEDLEELLSTTKLQVRNKIKNFPLWMEQISEEWGSTAELRHTIRALKNYLLSSWMDKQLKMLS